MDKLMDNRWFIKILALVLAVLLYSSVPHTTNSTKFTGVNVPGEQTTETLNDVPVKVYYDTENLVVSGIPNKVKLTLKGPVTHIQNAKALRNFEVYVDLTKAKIGHQTVKLKIKDLSDKLKATIKPSRVNVSVQEKITQEYKVDTEFNQGLLQEGFAAGQPVVEPNKVKITGAKNLIDRISYVKATLNVKDQINKTISQEANIQVLDRDLNKLDVEVDPSTVRVTIPVKDISKKVPIDIKQIGTPPSGVTIDSITLDTKDAVIIGSEHALKNAHVRVEVDVSKIDDNKTMDLPVIISNGITKVSPEMVTATIVVKKQEEKTISGIPLTILGLSDQYSAEINNPDNVDITVNGPSSMVNKLKSKDFNVFIDVSNLKEGDHNVKIQVEGPSEVDWELDQSRANVTITKNNA
ncbi:YbbR-like domain-containing protein [Bacillus salipaludis]|uniref:CdaR family protein n=1 Tax=Bacillus salipaludis TaxID=2547811 RepID=A0A4V3AT14_9BACI|nr:CdaR family protein [Bacillus salipaludis]MDQ6595493.1 CdaR family protein [Bacillus salipaludis]TDK57222.1 YbbR-like domain-containing protein [Bacillus salipaludis]